MWDSLAEDGIISLLSGVPVSDPSKPEGLTGSWIISVGFSGVEYIASRSVEGVFGRRLWPLFVFQTS